MFFLRKSSTLERILSFLIDIILILIFVFIVDELLFRINVEFQTMWILLFLIIEKDVFNGTSLGKKIFNLKVVDTNDFDKVVNMFRLTIRNITFFIWPFELLALLVDTQRMRIGDSLSKTVVVKVTNDDLKADYNQQEIFYNQLKTRDTKLILKVVLGIVGGIVLFVGGLILLIALVFKNSGAYEKTIEMIENNDEIIEYVGGIEGYGLMPLGSISTTNGYGEANIQVKIKGKTNSIWVGCYLQKKPRTEWEIIECY